MPKLMTETRWQEIKRILEPHRTGGAFDKRSAINELIAEMEHLRSSTIKCDQCGDSGMVSHGVRGSRVFRQCPHCQSQSGN